MNLPQLLVICGILIAVVLILFLPLPRSQRKASTPADRGRTGVVSRDDDRYWYGFFYSNPDDPALLVPKRFGLGWTINFGHPQSKLFIIGMMLILLLPVVVVILTFLITGTPPMGCHPSGCHSFP
ncbi:MAG: DUF5808 domain-containing protein [Ktedonobacteraceae bacterium]